MLSRCCWVSRSGKVSSAFLVCLRRKVIGPGSWPAARSRTALAILPLACSTERGLWLSGVFLRDIAYLPSSSRLVALRFLLVDDFCLIIWHGLENFLVYLVILDGLLLQPDPVLNQKVNQGIAVDERDWGGPHLEGGVLRPFPEVASRDDRPLLCLESVQRATEHVQHGPLN